MIKKLAAASWSDRIFDLVVYLAITVVTVATLYPFLNVLAISFNDSTDSIKGGITIYPGCSPSRIMRRSSPSPA